jgi:hypothetical protein
MMMEILEFGILGLHLLGVAAIIWGLATQLRVKKRMATRAAVMGARAQFVTGLVLVALDYNDLYLERLVLKIGLAVIILGLMEAFSKKPWPQAVYWGLWVLVLVQIGLANMISSK